MPFYGFHFVLLFLVWIFSITSQSPANSTTAEMRFAAKSAEGKFSPLGADELDRYGGIVRIHSARGRTGQWRVEKFGKRWLYVTPEGHGFWSLGVFDVAPGGNAIAKYGDQNQAWGPPTVRRLRSWGFNTILDHYNLWCHPVARHDQWPGDRTQPEKMPAVGFVDGASYPVRNVSSLAPHPAKNIFNGINTSYYKGYVAPSTDPFDPNFSAWINAWMTFSGDLGPTYGTSPWVIGFSLGETDYMWGFGAGSTADFATIPPGHNSPHLGWIVLVISPTQSGNPTWKQTYKDTTVYAKQALKTFIQGRYASISALNSAWGSNYTTFDSAGGWGSGTGVLDEDGRHRWVGNWDTLSGETAEMKKDLNDFLLIYAQKFFQVQRDAVKKAFPNKMYLGPNVVGSWGTPPRRQILQAAGQYIDVFMTNVGTGSRDDQQRLDFLMQYLGDRPVASWLGFPANPDSAMYQSPNPPTYLATTTQSIRGQEYDWMLNYFLNYTVTSTIPGVGGVKPFVGLRWWGYADSWGEKTNWGLVSPTENAYDGKEAVTAAGTDPWGYKTGGEARNYGNFIGAVQRANQAVLQGLIDEFSPKAASAQDPSTALRARSAPSARARQGFREPRHTLPAIAASTQPKFNHTKQAGFLNPEFQWRW
jgi:hypothetical protein